MMIFKTGDKVVVQSYGRVRVGWVLHRYGSTDGYKIRWASRGEGFARAEEMVLEEVYLSPLYAALKEDE